MVDKTPKSGSSSSADRLSMSPQSLTQLGHAQRRLLAEAPRWHVLNHEGVRKAMKGTFALLVSVVVAATLVTSATARTDGAGYMRPARMQYLIERGGVNFTGFPHVSGYKIVVDIARCRGLPRYGMRGSLFHGFRCSITTDDDSRYTLWMVASSWSSYYADMARLDWSSNTYVANCLEFSGDWEKCLGQYRP